MMKDMPPPSHLLVLLLTFLCFPLLLFSSDFQIWNYYVTMPMPASTFTLAVGHWHHVPAGTPPTLEKEVGDGAECGTMAKSRTNCKERAEAEPVSRLGNLSSEIVKDSPLQTGRYFISFPVPFSSGRASSSPDLTEIWPFSINCMEKVSFHHAEIVQFTLG